MKEKPKAKATVSETPQSDLDEIGAQMLDLADQHEDLKAIILLRNGQVMQRRKRLAGKFFYELISYFLVGSVCALSSRRLRAPKEIRSTGWFVLHSGFRSEV